MLLPSICCDHSVGVAAAAQCAALRPLQVLLLGICHGARQRVQEAPRGASEGCVIRFGHLASDGTPAWQAAAAFGR